MHVYKSHCVYTIQIRPVIFFVCLLVGTDQLYVQHAHNIRSNIGHASHKYGAHARHLALTEREQILVPQAPVFISTGAYRYNICIHRYRQKLHNRLPQAPVFKHPPLLSTYSLLSTRPLPGFFQSLIGTYSNYPVEIFKNCAHVQYCQLTQRTWYMHSRCQVRTCTYLRR